MPVIIPPPRHSLGSRLLRLLLLSLLVAGSILFVCYRFGETPTEKAERLFTQRRLAELKSYTQKRLGAGEASPLLMSYYIAAEFSSNAQASLESLLSNLRALDDRPIFRRETLQRLIQIPENRKRLGEILAAALVIEKPPGNETLALIRSILESDADLSGSSADFAALAEIFPRQVRLVSAQKLQLRSGPTTDSEVLRRLEDGERLLLRYSGPAVLVSGKRGRWVFTLDAQMVSGWVFDAYLAPEK
ncbi:MAG TPA: SH3 domain-containing protein [Turneriella sp.]|nr:SH3 domain-containing protein [Turneriella sp.]HMY10534.1 SH3 domain-containing protein [Turneriella sp.]HNE19202.1 SH3 domain-containing protein [Turneriella sp.]HNL54027.1 SH3 domain-containing protein [Turneriella sp.]HNM99458.1 SH3 domain-containing protein [Turneriella sp.]